MKLHYSGLPAHRYRAPVYVDLFSDIEFSREELIRWLVRVSKLVLDPTCGNGPDTKKSLGLCRIEWGELEQVKEEGGEHVDDLPVV